MSERHVSPHVSSSRISAGRSIRTASGTIQLTAGNTLEVQHMLIAGFLTITADHVAETLLINVDTLAVRITGTNEDLSVLETAGLTITSAHLRDAERSAR